jgi:hypothetical protein
MLIFRYGVFLLIACSGLLNTTGCRILSLKYDILFKRKACLYFMLVPLCLLLDARMHVRLGSSVIFLCNSQRLIIPCSSRFPNFWTTPGSCSRAYIQMPFPPYKLSVQFISLTLTCTLCPSAHLYLILTKQRKS